MKNYLLYSFVAPFQSKEFGPFSLACLLGTIGFSMAALTYAFDMSSKPMADVLIFYITTYGVIGLTIMPTAFMLYTWVRYIIWRRVMVGITLLPFAMNFIPVESQLAEGVILGIIVAPFWVLFHTVMMEISSSGENEGNSISLSLNMVSLGALLGIGLATLISTTSLTTHDAANIGAVLNTISIYLMCKTLRRVRGDMPAIDPERAFKSAVLGNPRRALITLVLGVSFVPASALWPLFIIHAGLSVVATGLYEVLSSLLRLCVSGHAGRLSDKGFHHAIRVSGLFFAAGKAPWLFAMNTLFVPFTILVWSVGRHFQMVGLSAMWYKNKTLGGLAALEFLLGIGRIAGLIVFVPLLFKAPTYFVMASVGVYLLTYIVCLRIQQPEQVKAEATKA